MRAGVLIPVHGFAPYLAETLDAVLAQGAAAAEVVVVDDGSPQALMLHPDHAAR
ncbi:MAG: putative glycosyltransferase, partial [Solirubrobacterales bacterium]|nr:putative glycosyltransferase [Solirubrobacterales bacterium]